MEDFNPISLSKMGEEGLKFADQFEMSRVLEAFALHLESVVAATSEPSEVGMGHVPNEESLD